MGRLIAATGLLAVAFLVLLAVHWRWRRRLARLMTQMENFLVSGGAPLAFSVKEDALAPLQNAAAELENQVMLAREQRQEERRSTCDLTADISHQLKTPLASLRLFCEMDASEHLEEQLSQIERMEGLISALLRLERLCAGGYEFTFAEQDMETVIQNAWQGMVGIYPKKRLKVEGSAILRCDEKWMREAFVNLFRNACEHTPEDSEITVQMEQSETAFFCAVSDRGGGVAAKELPHLFDRFYRAHSRETTGAGIGLSIVKEIIHRHHGSIYAENISEGLKVEGLKVVMTIPILNLTKS